VVIKLVLKDLLCLLLLNPVEWEILKINNELRICKKKTIKIKKKKNYKNNDYKINCFHPKFLECQLPTKSFFSSSFWSCL
jgi:hypothetical protein